VGIKMTTIAGQSINIGSYGNKLKNMLYIIHGKIKQCKCNVENVSMACEKELGDICMTKKYKYLKDGLL
jgi:hypothetical protein